MDDAVRELICASGTPVARQVAEERVRVLKALADPTRLQVLSMLIGAPNGEVCGCGLNKPLQLSQSTVSYHLKILIDAGLVCRRRSGTWMWYAACSQHRDLLSVLLPTPTT